MKIKNLNTKLCTCSLYKEINTLIAKEIGSIKLLTLILIISLFGCVTRNNSQNMFDKTYNSEKKYFDKMKDNLSSISDDNSRTLINRLEGAQSNIKESIEKAKFSILDPKEWENKKEDINRAFRDITLEINSLIQRDDTDEESDSDSEENNKTNQSKYKEIRKFNDKLNIRLKKLLKEIDLKVEENVIDKLEDEKHDDKEEINTSKEKLQEMPITWHVKINKLVDIIKKAENNISKNIGENSKRIIRANYQELIDYIERLKITNYYTLLNIPRDAEPEWVQYQAKYFRITFHENKYINLKDEKTKHLMLSEIISIIDLAANILIDPKSRADYDYKLIFENRIADNDLENEELYEAINAFKNEGNKYYQNAKKSNKPIDFYAKAEYAFLNALMFYGYIKKSNDEKASIYYNIGRCQENIGLLKSKTTIHENDESKENDEDIEKSLEQYNKQLIKEFSRCSYSYYNAALFSPSNSKYAEKSFQYPYNHFQYENSRLPLDFINERWKLTNCYQSIGFDSVLQLTLQEKVASNDNNTDNLMSIQKYYNNPYSGSLKFQQEKVSNDNTDNLKSKQEKDILDINIELQRVNKEYDEIEEKILSIENRFKQMFENIKFENIKIDPLTFFAKFDIRDCLSLALDPYFAFQIFIKHCFPKVLLLRVGASVIYRIYDIYKRHVIELKQLYTEKDNLDQERRKLEAKKDILLGGYNKIALDDQIKELKKNIKDYNSKYIQCLKSEKEDCNIEEKLREFFREGKTLKDDIIDKIKTAKAYREEDMLIYIIDLQLNLIDILMKIKIIETDLIMLDGFLNEEELYNIQNDFNRNITLIIEELFKAIEVDIEKKINLKYILQIVLKKFDISRREFKTILNPIDIQAYLQNYPEEYYQFFRLNSSQNENNNQSEKPNIIPLKREVQMLKMHLEKNYDTPSKKGMHTILSLKKIQKLKTSDNKKNCLRIPINQSPLSGLMAINKSLEAHYLPFLISLDDFKDKTKQLYYENKDINISKWINDDKIKKESENYDKWEKEFFSVISSLSFKLISKLYNIKINVCIHEDNIFKIEETIDERNNNGFENNIYILDLSNIGLFSKAYNYYEAINAFDEKELTEINNSLDQQKDSDKKSELLRKRAELYFGEALEAKKGNNRLLWEEKLIQAIEDFEFAYRLDANLIEDINYFESLLQLKKYSKILSILKTRNWNSKNLENSLSLIKANVLINTKDFDTACDILNDIKEEKSQTNENNNEIIDKKNKLKARIESRKKIYEQLKLSNEQFLEKESTHYNLNPKNSSNIDKKYHILSIDGGGIRGIIPAIWAIELEKQTRKNIATLFDMASGTSTGGILAAAFGIPNNYGNPKYTAVDLAKIYLTHGSDIFENPGNIATLAKPKYSSIGIEKILNRYCDKARLKNQLTEVLITSVDENNAYNPYLFTRYKARRNANDDFELKDVLRATSAAPTFFSQFRYGNHSFLDGGLKLNNPSLAAYNFIIDNVQNISKDDIYIISLGTGEHKNYENHGCDNYRGKLYWAANIADATLENQETIIDYNLSRILPKDNYYRYQVELQSLIPLDSIKPSDIQNLREAAAISIENAYEDGSLPKLIEQLMKPWEI